MGGVTKAALSLGMLGRVLGRRGVLGAGYGALAGAGVGAGELATGVADPAMSVENKLNVVLSNALLGGLLGHPSSRGAILARNYLRRSPLTGPAGEALFSVSRGPRWGGLASVAGAGAGIPAWFNATDPTARLARRFQGLDSSVPAALAEATKRSHARRLPAELARL